MLKKNPAQERRWRTLVTAKGKGGQGAATCTGIQPTKHDAEWDFFHYLYISNKVYGTARQLWLPSQTTERKRHVQ